MNAATVAVVLSALSLLISGTALGWNIYKEIALRARLRVKIRIAVIVMGNSQAQRAIVSVTNFGPGKARPNSLLLRKLGPWRLGKRKHSMAFLVHDYEDALSAKLPAELEVGQSLDLTFRLMDNIFFNSDYDQIGITDSFSKVHWCAPSAYAEARSEYRTIRAKRQADADAS